MEVKNGNDICVITGFTNNISILGNFTALANRSYCLQNNYDFRIFKDKDFDKSRPASWSKIKFIKKVLPDYKFVFWIDSDAIFTNMRVRLEDFIVDGKDFYMCQDIPKTKFNGGVMLFRNSEWVFWLLDEIWKIYPHNYGGWEQQTISALYNEGKLDDRFYFYPHRCFNGFLIPTDIKDYKGFTVDEFLWHDGDFVAHCTNASLYLRLFVLRYVFNLRVEK